MPKQYRQYKNIQVGGDKAYSDQVISCLDELRGMHSGAAFLDALNGTAHMLTIGPRNPPDSPSNYCEEATDGKFTILAKAIKDNDMTRARMDLTAALGTAARGGITRDFVAQQLANGLLKVTYSSAHNIGMPLSKISIPQTAKGDSAATGKAIADAKSQARTMLDEFLAGKRTTLPPGWDEDLQRILRPYLQPGRGTTCTIGFDPAQTYPCAVDPARKNRPPLIGLAHEMVHAWRAMTGRNLYITNTNFDIEEVITTGFPPYNSEQFSENLFRAQYTGPELVMRVTYSWLPDGQRPLPSSR